ncbi:MAG: DUF4430 domain-containing protein, partial [Clostridia bacterium]|nr:DUF4430 domain-containing protein [Clostridia bacterium]
LIQHVSEKEIANPVTKQKYALALLASGYSSDFVQMTADECVGKLGIMSYVYALHLAENGFLPNGMTVEVLVQKLLEKELENGGFAVTGTIFDTDVTAMVLQALAPHRNQENVKPVLERALTRLSEAQTENGGFVNYGVENAESCAQVIIMMASLGVELTDSRFVKNGNTVLDALLSFRCENGGFSHTKDAAVGAQATAQAYLAMCALENGSFYKLKGLDGLSHIVYTPSPSASKEAPAVSWRIYAVAAIAAAVLLCCFILFVCKKRHYKNFLLILLTGAVLCLLIFTLDFQSADDYYGTQAPKENVVGTVTLAIRCDVLNGKTELSYIPEDGVILEKTEFAIAEGESVFDILEEAVRSNRLQMEYGGTGELIYIKGIGYLYELAHGDLSGWIYRVNGESPSVGCASYTLSDGDTVEWHYTLNQGKDIPQE